MTNKPHADSVAEVLEFFDDKKAWHGSQSVMCVSYLEANDPRQLLVIRREALGTCLWLQGDEEWISNHPVARDGEAQARVESETVHIPGRFFIDDARARAAVVEFAQGAVRPERVLWHQLEPGEIQSWYEKAGITLASKYLVSFSAEQLFERGLSSSFAKILADPVGYHPELRFLIGKTAWEYVVAADAEDIVPLWDDNADSYVRWTRHGHHEYVQLFHDDPEWVAVAQSEQGMMAVLWKRWCEVDGRDEADFARAIGFRHAEEASRLWQLDSDALESWIETLGAPRPVTVPPSPPADFANGFARARAQLIAELHEAVEERRFLVSRVCDEDGTARKWRFQMTDSEMLTHETGDLTDAVGFLENMINQGMFVAFALAGPSSSTTVWLTCWETSEEKPRWPDGVLPVIERFFLGVRKSAADL